MAEEKYKLPSDGECRDILAERDARAFPRKEVVSVSLFGDQEIWRTWERLNVGSDDDASLIDGYRAWLEDYTSAKNTNKQKYVDDPMINKSIVMGRYRQAFIRLFPSDRGDNWQFVQVLRKGYIQTLITTGTTVDWSEASLSSRRNLPPGATEISGITGTATAEDYLVIEWNNVDATKANTIAYTELNQNTFTNVTVDGVAYSGTWNRVDVVVNRNKEDGSATVILLVARPQFTVKEYRDHDTEDAQDVYKYNGVPKPLVDGILSLHQVEGASAYTQYSAVQGLVDITITKGTDDAIISLTVKSEDGCQEEEWRDIYYGLELAEAYAIVASGSAQMVAPSGWIYNSQGPNRLSNGRYVVAIIRRQAVAVSSIDATVADDVDETVVETVLRNQESGGTWASFVAYAQGVLKSVGYMLNRFCRYDVQKRTITSKPTSVRFTITTAAGHTEQHVFAYWRRIPSWNDTTIISLHDPSTLAATYRLHLASFQRNSDGTFSWHSIVSGPVGLDPAADAIEWTVYGESVYKNTPTYTGGVVTGVVVEVSYHKYKHSLKAYTTEQAAYTAISGAQLDGTRVWGDDGAGWQAEVVSDDGWTAFAEVGA